MKATALDLVNTDHDAALDVTPTATNVTEPKPEPTHEEIAVVAHQIYEEKAVRGIVKKCTGRRQKGTFVEKPSTGCRMKPSFFLLFYALLTFGAIAEDEKDVLSKLTLKLGPTFWSAPEKRLVRATTYQKGKDGSGDDSRKGKSDEKINLRYATAKEAGTLAVPDWLSRGSMVKIFTNQGVLSYIAADKGRGVETREAAKASGKTEEQKAASVLDFCAEKQLWPDFIIVEIYYYSGKVPFTELTLEEQKALFSYAMEYVTKRE